MGNGVQRSERRALLVSKGWVQAVALVMLFGFFVLGLLAYRTYMAKPPTPERVVDPQGARALHGRGHPRRASRSSCTTGSWSTARSSATAPTWARTSPPTTCGARRRSSGAATAARGPTGRPQRRSRTSGRTATTRRAGTLTLSAPQAAAFRRLVGHYSRFFSEPTTKHGLRPGRDHRPHRAAPAHRVLRLDGVGRRRPSGPGKNYSYTNNWPPEPRVDNKPTANVVVWSVLSLIALLGGIGLLFAAFGRWQFLGWHGREQATLTFRTPGDVALTPAQRACAWFFFVMAALFLIQTLRRRRLAALPRRARQLLRLRPRAGLPLQPHAHLARAARAVLGGDVLRRRGHLPRADDRPARAEASGQARLRAARRAGRRRLRHPDRLVPRHPRRARGRRRRTGSACRASSTSTSPASGRCCSRVGLFVWVFMLWRVLRRRLARRAPRQHAVAVLPRRAARSRPSTPWA